MAAPLQSEISGPKESLQFAHFGVLNAGSQSKASTLTALILNLTIIFVVLVISAATAKRAIHRQRLTELAAPVIQKKIEPIKPKIVPPKIKLPEIAKVELPKIVVPEIKMPDVPKPPAPVVKMETPKPILTPPAPQQVIAKAAPVVVSLAHPAAASVPNNDAHPSAVRLGSADSPVNNLHGPSVAQVNMGRGMPGMNSANSGNGPAATKVNFGNGSPGSTSITGRGAVAVTGLAHGVPGGTGTARTVGQVNLGGVPPPSAPKPAAAVAAARTPVKVLSKPKPEYTQEAIDKHVEGVVSVHIRVEPNGAVQVLAITKPLGYGLDESAKRAVMATKFQPATDASGNPVAWDGVVNITFQLAG
ncbi:MAG TPA: energy transducer TonB [Acidobacteriaceae bacterium]|nr:energy transducer TonB [Acidobacteriaceae bacterium]